MSWKSKYSQQFLYILIATRCSSKHLISFMPAGCYLKGVVK